MNSPFNSRFAKQMDDMLNFKEALGYSRNSYHKFLLNFDRFSVASIFQMNLFLPKNSSWSGGV